MDWRSSALAQRTSLTAKSLKFAMRVSFQVSFVAMKQERFVAAWGEVYGTTRAQGEGTESKKRSAWLEGGGKKDRTGE